MAAKKTTSKKTPKKTTLARSKKSDPKGNFDAVSGSNNATGNGNKRRKSNIETKEETGAQGLLRPYDRLHSLNLCRDVERNYSQAKSIIHQMKVNVIGPSPKAQVNTGDEFGREATEWLNGVWMKNCDFRQDRRFAKLAQLVVAAKAREGDLLVVFDDDMIEDTGQILFYESDMICDVSGLDAKFKAKGWSQQDGIIKDKFGREIGYVGTYRRGQTSVPEKDATIFTRDPINKENNMVKLIRSDYRLLQGRGISPLLAAISDFLDCYEMRAKELQSAKKAAGDYAYVTRKEAVANFDDVRFDPDNENPSDQDADYDGDTLVLPEAQEEPVNYEALEKLTGGYTDYMADGDEVKFPEVNRPNVQMKEFLDYVMDSGGAAFGMAHAYTRMKADTSYTAFRGDMVLSWVSFVSEQKDAEDEFLDWSAIRAIRWKIKKGGFENEPTEGWEKKISWMLPKIPFIDELKERKAHETGLKTGELTYSQLLGPDWLQHLKQLAEELKEAEALGLPLSIFETKSGGATAPANSENNNGGNNNEQD